MATCFCRNCGHVHQSSGGLFPLECPRCKYRYNYNQDVEFDSLAEKESYDRACEKEKKTGLMMLTCAALTFVLAFPGILVLMLLHSMVDIDSEFWNWLLSIIFSGVIFMICKGNIITFLKVDAVMIGISTVIGWCVSDFRPWGFAISTFFGNPWLAIICCFAGIFILDKYCPKVLDRFVVK